MRLLSRRLVTEGLQNPIFQLVAYHFAAKIQFFLHGLYGLHGFFINFAADMQISNKVINILLALVAAGLLAVCIASVMGGVK